MRSALVILALCLLAWLIYTLLEIAFWSDDVAVGESREGRPNDRIGAPTEAGTENPADIRTTGETDERTSLADQKRFRARVVEASGEPVTHFWVGILPRREGRPRYSAPPFRAFGTYHDFAKDLLEHEGVREVRTPDGWFSIDQLDDPRAALFILAEQRAVLFAVGEPFGLAASAPVFVLKAPGRRRVRVLDHDDESPVAEAALQLRDFGEFDFIAKLRSVLGSRGLGFAVPPPSGLRSDADGVIDIPMHVRVAVYKSDPRPVYATLFLPDLFTVHKPGYAHAQVLWDHIVEDRDHLIYLDGSSSTLRVRIVDIDDTPILAGLLITCRGDEMSELGCFTDARGECELRDLPPGKTTVRISVPENPPENARGGALVPEHDVREAGHLRSDSRDVFLEPGKVTVLAHRMGTKAPEIPKAWLHGAIRRKTRVDSIRISIQSGPTGSSRQLVGDSYELAVTPGTAIKLEIRHVSLGLTQSIELEPMASGTRRRLDITPPTSAHLVRFAGSLVLGETAKAWLPDKVHLELLAGRPGLPRTEAVTLFEGADKLANGAEFDVRISPGRYRVHGSYRTDPRFTTWNWFRIEDIEVTRSVENARITLPAVSRFRVAPQDLSGKPLRPRYGQFAMFVRPTDRPDDFRHRRILAPGNYELTYIARGYLPHRSSFEVRGTGETVIPVRLSPGRGAVLKGKIVDADGKRTITRTVRISCALPGGGGYQLFGDVEMGRFEFTGLIDGEYVLTVVDEDRSDVKHEFEFALEPGQIRDKLTLPLPRAR